MQQEWIKLRDLKSIFLGAVTKSGENSFRPMVYAHLFVPIGAGTAI